MKKLFLLAAVLFSIPVFSQSADERIGTLINQSDWFGLEENYPILKDSMQVDFLKLMSEIMIGLSNRRFKGQLCFSSAECTKHHRPA